MHLATVVERVRSWGVLAGLALFALGWATARACIQSVVIDEADSYMTFARSWEGQWYPSNGNHVLHTLLVRLVTWVFGLSEFTLRVPALLGAVIYIVSALHLSCLITGRKLLQIALFICLVFNPFVFDYYVAAQEATVSRSAS